MKPKSAVAFLLENPDHTLAYKLLPNLIKHSPLWHIAMLRDKKRLKFYEQNLMSSVKDKVVLDLGSGTGILSHLALKFGARKVYSVERNSFLQDIYQHLLAAPIAEGKAVLISKNIHDLSVEDFQEPVTLIIHELFGSDGVSEDIIAITKKIRSLKFLEKAEIFPNQFSIKLRMVSSPDIDEKFLLNDIDGFQLSSFTELALSVPRLLGHDEFSRINVQSLSDPKMICSFDLLTQDEKDLSTDFFLDAPAGTTHLMVSLLISGNHSTAIDTDFFLGPSHWSNVVFRLTPGHSRYRFFSKFNGNFTFTAFPE